MIVLVNGYSASASEITAGTLQDDGRAKLLGETTYGKGTVQEVIPLPNNNGALKVTIARWLTAKGILVQEEAKNPVDVELESFFQNCRDGKTPRADLEIGMNDAIAVILSNLAMDEGRKVYFNEIEKMGVPQTSKT
jgi:carboxyl-terminal processing protease